MIVASKLIVVQKKFGTLYRVLQNRDKQNTELQSATKLHFLKIIFEDQKEYRMYKDFLYKKENE